MTATKSTPLSHRNIVLGMTAPKSTPLSHRNIVLMLLGIGFIYQAMFHLMWRALGEEERDECGGSAGGGVAESPQCTELRLFRAWDDEPLARPPLQLFHAWDDEPWHTDGAAGGDWEQLGKELTPLLPPTWWRDAGLGANASAHLSPARTAPPDTDSQLDIIMQAVHASLAKNVTTPWAQSLENQQRRLQEEMDALPSKHHNGPITTYSEFDRVYNATLAILSNRSAVTPWARSLETLQARLEERKSHLASTKRQRAEEFDRLYNETLAAIHNRPKVTPFAQHLEDVQAQLQAEMDALPSAQRKHTQDSFEALYNATMAVLYNRSEMTPWAKGVKETQERLQAAMDVLPVAHHRAGHNASAPKPAVPAPTQAPLLDRINQLGREMCLEPERRHRLSCLQFLKSPKETLSDAKAAWRVELRREEKQREATLDARLAELTAGRKEWEMAMLTKLARDGANVSESMLLRATTAQPASATSSSLRGVRRPEQLRWRSAAEWSDSRTRLAWGPRGGPLVLQPEQLEAAHWSGKIPAVTCLTAVPSGLHARSRMQYFVDNFRKQTYEGPHQLVLVYHASDHAAAKLVHEFADGFFIKGAATRGSEPFPSTTAMRYAAWASEADVIARWDLYEFHHPERLSMQVRALASAMRPGCALKRAAAHGEVGAGAGAALGGEFWEESLVGEKSWMQKYWHPYMGTPEQLVLEGAQGHHMVEVELGAAHHHHHEPAPVSSGTAA